MKTKIITAVLIMFITAMSSITVFAENNLNKTFIGYWTTDGSKARTVIFKDKNDLVQMIEWDSSDGEEIEVRNINVVNDSIETTEVAKSTNWVTYNTYTIVNENTLKCVIGGDANGTVIYLKRIK